MDYHTWQTEHIQIREQSLTIYHKPGMAHAQGMDMAELLLAEHMDLASDGLALCLNCGTGLVGALAARLAPQGCVHMATHHAVDLAATRRTIQSNALPNAIAQPSHGVSGLDGLPPQDMVTIRLPKGKLPALQLIWDAYQVLRPGGRAYLAGGNKEGIKTYLQHLGDLFGNMALLAYRKGHRVGVATKREGPEEIPPAFQDPWLSHDTYLEFPAQVRGLELTIRSRPGIFSWDRLDPATKALIQQLQVHPGDQVLDLGCGYGIIGMAAAKMGAGQTYLLDADVRAVEAARRNVSLNDLASCQVLLSDCAQGVADNRFEVIATNPPFHRGQGTDYHMARQFILDAARLLRQGGRFYLVANRFLPYEGQLEAAFGHAHILHQDNRFKVLMARR